MYEYQKMLLYHLVLLQSTQSCPLGLFPSPGLLSVPTLAVLHKPSLSTFLTLPCCSVDTQTISFFAAVSRVYLEQEGRRHLALYLVPPPASHLHSKERTHPSPFFLLFYLFYFR